MRSSLWCCIQLLWISLRFNVSYETPFLWKTCIYICFFLGLHQYSMFQCTAIAFLSNIKVLSWQIEIEVKEIVNFCRYFGKWCINNIQCPYSIFHRVLLYMNWLVKSKLTASWYGSYLDSWYICIWPAYWELWADIE